MLTELEQRFMQRVPNTLNDISNTLQAIAENLHPTCVWVFTGEQAWDGEVADIIVKAFPSEDAAVKYMHDFLLDDGGDESIRQYVERKDWEVELDVPMLYRASRHGYDATDHIELTLTKCVIEK